MQKWEHRHRYIMWDNQHKEYYIDTDGQKMWGFEQILDWYGEKGWEVINIVPAFASGEFTSDTHAGSQTFAVQANDYMAFFKRPKL